MSGTRSDVREHNRIAWDALVEQGNEWTVPVSSEAIDAARKGRWEIVLTPTKPVPREWLEVAGRQVLCLASGGGQQAPILAAAGANVTVLDNSPKQLDRDAKMAERHGLPITTVLGDMANLEMFADGSFDLIVHPCSNCFVPDVLPVWREAFRVLRRGCCMIAGFANPADVRLRFGRCRQNRGARSEAFAAVLRMAPEASVSRWNSAIVSSCRSAGRLRQDFPSSACTKTRELEATATC